MTELEIGYREFEKQEYEKKIIITYAQQAYEAYCAHTNYKSLATGQNLPKWENLPQNIKDAWFASAKSLVRSFYESRGW